LAEGRPFLEHTQYSFSRNNNAAAAQLENTVTVAQNRNFLASVNHGSPATAAVATPGSRANRPDDFAAPTAADRHAMQTASASNASRGTAGTTDAWSRFNHSTSTAPQFTGERSASGEGLPTAVRTQPSYAARQVPDERNASATTPGRTLDTERESQRVREPFAGRETITPRTARSFGEGSSNAQSARRASSAEPASAHHASAYHATAHNANAARSERSHRIPRDPVAPAGTRARALIPSGARRRAGSTRLSDIGFRQS
jgi:hypothetical protein